MSGAIPVLNL